LQRSQSVPTFHLKRSGPSGEGAGILQGFPAYDPRLFFG